MNNSKLDTMIALVANKFVGKYDKSGEPYVLHCLHVMNQMPEEDHDLRCIAVGHDLVEDTDVTLVDLLEMGFSERVIVGIDGLTHSKDEPYMDYIRRLAPNDDCRMVKMADLHHNADIFRMRGIYQKDHDRIEKYHRAFYYLKNFK